MPFIPLLPFPIPTVMDHNWACLLEIPCLWQLQKVDFSNHSLIRVMWERLGDTEWDLLRCRKASRDVGGSLRASAQLLWGSQRMRISLVLNHSPEVCKFSSFMSTMEGWVFCVKIICPSAKTHSIQKRHLFPSETGLGLLVMRFWIPLLDKHCRPAEVQAECERNLERANLEEGDVDYQCHLGTTCDRRHWACSTNPPVLSLEEIALSTAHGRPSAISRTKQSQDGAEIVMGITGVKNGGLRCLLFMPHLL